MSDYVYQRTEFSPYELYTVGYYDPSGKWQSESDYQIKEEAAKRVNFLNGSQSDELNRLKQENEQLKELLRLAVEDMKTCVVDTGCEVCGNKTCEGFDDCEYEFIWQHADKLKGLIEI